MRLLSLSLLTTLLLLSTPVAAAPSWFDDVVDWFSGLFATEVTAAPAPGPSSTTVDSLRATPLGLALNFITDSDTLAVEQNWPYLSADVGADLERYERLKQRTVLLTDPTAKLPLTADAVRVIYAPGERPGYFLQSLTRHVDVQEVVYDTTVAEVLAVSPHLPTVLVVNGSQRAGAWYQIVVDTSVNEVTLVHFGRAQDILALPTAWSVINCPLRAKESEVLLAQALVGAENIDGQLENGTTNYTAGLGYPLSGTKSGYRMPEQMSIDRNALEDLDYQINRGIRYRAMPGAQVVVMKGGQVVYEKAYGRQTYRGARVGNGDLYDLASVTKAAATTLAVMKLYDEGRLELSARVRDYLPELTKTVLGSYTIDRVLAHQTGLQPNLPVGQFMSREFTADTLAFSHRFPLGPNKWLDSRMPSWVVKSLQGKIERSKTTEFVYSDLNYYLLQLVVERISSQSLDQYVHRTFYQPMGLGKIGFNPLAKYPAQRLVPTIHESWMRGGLLRGYVHDEGAALLAGVAGHAGLFSNARDLARLFQLFNDGGSAGGVRYLSPATVATFTRRNPYNYRALGFDRLVGRWRSATNYGAGRGTIGHLGYTGTSVWADAEHDLVIVLLTNRINPNPANDKFLKMGIRNRVNRAVYRALNGYEPEA